MHNLPVGLVTHRNFFVGIDHVADDLLDSTIGGISCGFLQFEPLSDLEIICFDGLFGGIHTGAVTSEVTRAPTGLMNASIIF